MLYEPAFAVVTSAFGSEYRRGITLVGGLASTIFIPVAQLAVEHLGWRGALIGLGLFQFVVGVPLHFWGVPKTTRLPPAVAHATPVVKRLRAWWAEFHRDVGDVRFVGLALWFTAHAAAFTGLIFQLVPILQALSVDNATVLQAIAVIGPMQVLGRFFLTTRGSHFSTLRLVVGRWSRLLAQ